ncbi:MAG: DNA polymerase/3'-5' exonuclease PolX [Anaerolineales bacterium]|uniref:DNA polymerase/3'-5' exonuclease PolX n=1 Tax=Candidatus Villigracilis vicinus TaxID=3140679 RepID=UPI003136B57D|nr:DNA polymerase/3'-5' exonuclease PolX [Anaerolineales bacterium]
MMNNKQLAGVFTLIANLLEIKGEIIYKTLAYRKASESLDTLGREASEYWKEGKLADIPGVGKAIAEKIDELLNTGKLEFLEKLKKEVPESLAGWLQVPSLGPKKIAMIWKALNITTLPELEAAAKAGKLKDLPGMGAKSETAILEGIASLARRSGRLPLGKAYPLVQEIIKVLKAVKGVVDVQPAGSLRRMRSTVGDLDILVAAKDSAPVMDAFVNLKGVERVLGRGEFKASIEFFDGVRAQVWVHPPQEFGTALQYATGSKDHNVQLRQIALDKGLSLSDHSFKKIKGGQEIFCATEEEVYKTLGLQYVPPEMREDRGEVEAAKANKLPKLIQVKDIKSDLHMHSTYSDGKLSMLDMAREAIKRGLKVITFTDHSVSLGVANGLSIERHKQQAAEIKKIQKQLGDEILILHGSEVEIKADGSLDYPDEFLASLDLVVASLHSSLRQPREKVTQRLLNAINNPHVDIIGHPTGREIPDREGADLDMEAVFQAAAKSGVALEINAHPSRLDLDDAFARRAKDLGVLISINTDSHAGDGFDVLPYGIATARRAWLEPKDVINTWTPKKLTDWLKKRG